MDTTLEQALAESNRRAIFENQREKLKETLKFGDFAEYILHLRDHLSIERLKHHVKNFNYNRLQKNGKKTKKE